MRVRFLRITRWLGIGPRRYDIVEANFKAERGVRSLTPYPFHAVSPRFKTRIEAEGWMRQQPGWVDGGQKSA